MQNLLLRNSLKLFVAIFITAAIATWAERIQFLWYPLMAVVIVVDDNDDHTVQAATRRLAAGRPLLGVGLSLGGTVLLNGLLDAASPGLLDGLAVVSSPIDLASSSAAIGLPRNRIYERWLLQRLRQQTLADPAGLQESQRRQLQAVRSIRTFDALITAPRWGFDSVEAYYAGASPLGRLQSCLAEGQPERRLPPLLLVHALDDPWVPAAPAVALSGRLRPVSPLQTVLSCAGGHNGFHGPGGSWSDLLVTRWLLDQVQGRR